MKEPKISVVMITYGHEKYLEEAINGVLMQKTDFPVEFIIANDCSPDNSDIIIKEIISHHPENFMIKYKKHEKNIGMMPNFMWALQQAKAKYIAICEGDDYWTEEKKLQKQVDFLENNPAFAVSAHNVKILRDKLYHESPNDKTNLKSEYTLEDLAKRNIFHTASLVLRNVTEDLPPWFKDAPFGDYPLLMTAAKTGKIHYDNEKMAVYRENVGIWSGQKRPYRRIIDTLGEMQKMLSDKNAIKNLATQQTIFRKLFLLSLPLKEAITTDDFKELSLKDKSIILAKKMIK